MLIDQIGLTECGIEERRGLRHWLPEHVKSRSRNAANDVQQYENNP
jgi:hypothetical protein